MSQMEASEASHTGGRVLAQSVSTKLMARNMTMAKAGMVRDLFMVGGVRVRRNRVRRCERRSWPL